MKTRLLSITFLLLLFVSEVEGVEHKFTLKQVQPTVSYVCPGVVTRYVCTLGSYVDDPNAPLYYEWTVTNGVFSGSASTAYIFKANIPSVEVKWDNLSTKGTISLKIICSKDNFLVNGKPTGVLEVAILNLSSVQPTWENNVTEFALGVQPQKITINSIDYPNAKEVTGVAHKVEKYEWILPSGWSCGNNKGTFQTESNSIVVTPHPFNSGTVSVCGINSCNSSKSKFATRTYSRPFKFQSYPASIPFNSMDSYTFSVPSITNVQYEWRTPAGWSINGGGNTLTTSSSEVQIRALNYTTEKVQVRLRLNQDVSDWYTCPGGAIAVPEITASVDGTIYQYEPLNFTINGLNGSNATINWKGDGYIINGQGSAQANIAPTAVGAMNIYADISIPGYGSYTVGKQVSIANHRISLNKTVNSFGEGSCSLVNRPEGTDVDWMLLDNGYTIRSSDNSKAILAPLLYNATSTLRVNVYSNWMRLPLTIDFTSAPLELTGPDFVLYKRGRCEINYLPRRASLRWVLDGLMIREQKNNYVDVTVSLELPEARPISKLKAVVTLSNGNSVEVLHEMQSLELKGFNLELVQSNSRSSLYKASYTPANIPYKELLIYWGCADENVSISTMACKGSVPDSVVRVYESYRRKSKYPPVVIEGGGGFSMNSIIVPEPDDDDGLPLHLETNYAIFSFPGIQPASAAIWCTVLDQAGNIITKRASISTSINSSPYQLASNPVDNTLTLKKNDFDEVQTYENKTSETLTVQLYNDYSVVKTVQANEEEEVLQMNTADLPNGTYYLNISKGGVVVTRQLVLIKH